jgi:hypothetical protein
VTRPPDITKPRAWSGRFVTGAHSTHRNIVFRFSETLRSADFIPQEKQKAKKLPTSSLRRKQVAATSADEKNDSLLSKNAGPREAYRYGGDPSNTAASPHSS